MTRKIYRLLILLAVFWILPMPHLSYAQEDEGLSEQQQEWLTYVQGAFANFTAATSLSIQGGQLTTQTLSSPAIGTEEVVISNEQQYDSDMLLDGTGQVIAVSSGIDQTSMYSAMGQEVRQVMIMESVLVDGTLWVAVPNFEDSNGNPNPFPTEWTNLNEDGDQFPGIELFDLEALMDYSSQLLPFGDLTDAIVLTIAEAEGVEVEGKMLRVFEVEYDMAAIAEAGGFGLGRIYSEEMATTLGLSGDELVRELFQEATMHQTLWIDPDTQQLHRIKAVLQIDADIYSPALQDSLHIIQTTTAVQQISNINAPLTIEAPIIEE
ncbi:MAG: hypothetical protein K8L91_13295 [Anaerolineae bacterium]|nr:hypothetical protein [Anaerolineae bacterium]